MSVWQGPSSPSALGGSEGELVSVAISVEPRELESLLEALANVDFPINPQIYHAEGHNSATRTTVVFPAYSGSLPLVRAALDAAGQDTSGICVKAMLEEIQSLVSH